MNKEKQFVLLYGNKLYLKLIVIQKRDCQNLGRLLELVFS